MTREEAEIYLYSIAGDLGFTDAENYTCKDGEKMREAIEVLTQKNMLIPNFLYWEEADKQEIAKSVVLLDLFTKIFCRYRNDYERFDDLKFRCDECPFSKPNGYCMCKEFKNKYAPDYKDFGSMGDL